MVDAVSEGAIAATSPSGASEVLPQRFEALMVRIGRLNCAWTNTESVLVEVLARLMGTPVRKAAVVFLTLNTTRARIDLVERLVRLEDGGHGQLLPTLRTFRRLSRMRNKLNHSIYDVDGASGTLQTRETRVVHADDGIEFGKVELVDDRELERIDAAIRTLRDVNAALWAFAREPSPGSSAAHAQRCS